MLKKLNLILAMVFLLSCANYGFAQVYEGFDYPLNASIIGQNGGTGWSGGWGAYNASATVKTGLSYSGLNVIGNSLGPVSGSNPQVYRNLATPIAATNGTSFRISVLITCKGAFSEMPNKFGTTGTDYFAFGCWGPHWFVKIPGSGNVGPPVALNSTNYIVVQIDYLNGNDRISVWINKNVAQTNLTSPITIPADITVMRPVGNFNSFSWSGSVSSVDEIRIEKITCATPPSQMISWYTFDETSGTTAFDKIGGGSNGVHKNSPTPVAGKVAGALSFNGTTNYVEAPSTAGSLVTSGFTIDAWVKINPASPNQFMPIVDKRTQGTSQYGTFYKGYSFYISGKNRLGFLLGTGPPGFPNPMTGFDVWSSPTVNLTDNNWHHIALTVNRTMSVIVWYFDGNQIGTSTPVNRPGSIGTNSPLYIGHSPYNLLGSQGYFDGAMDELELFMRVLTAAEIKSIYDAQASGKCK